MITEDYVSFEVAKLLKDKGFNEDCSTYYTYNGWIINASVCINFNAMDSTSAPTHQMVLKWLREVYNIHIDVYYALGYKRYCYSCRTPKDDDQWDVLLFQTKHKYDKYEDAMDDAIKECLKVIEN